MVECLFKSVVCRLFSLDGKLGLTRLGLGGAKLSDGIGFRTCGWLRFWAAMFKNAREFGLETLRTVPFLSGETGLGGIGKELMKELDLGVGFGVIDGLAGGLGL